MGILRPRNFSIRIREKMEKDKNVLELIIAVASYLSEYSVTILFVERLGRRRT